MVEGLPTIPSVQTKLKVMEKLTAEAFIYIYIYKAWKKKIDNLLNFDAVEEFSLQPAANQCSRSAGCSPFF